MEDYDVVIIGAGPSGCSTAINFQNGLKVAIIERTHKACYKIGESLPPASKRLLQDMGRVYYPRALTVLWHSFDLGQ